MPMFFLDIETDGLDPFTCKLVTLQIMRADGKALICKDPKDPNEMKRLKDVLENNLIIGHNIKFDAKFLKYHYGITLKKVYDTYIAEIVLSGGLLAGRKGASLKDLVHKYCGVDLSKEEQCSFRRNIPLTAAQETYAINDLKYLPIIMRAQREKADILKLKDIINTEMRALPAVVWLELSGIHMDIEKVHIIKKVLLKKKINAERYLYEQFASSKINLNSSQQLIKALNRLGIPVKNASDEELSKYRQYKCVKMLKSYKEKDKLLNTFVEKIPTYINPVTKRVHSNFNQYGAKSGRFTSSNPNLQQQPSKFSKWRSVYIAEPGNSIITADYSQIELRIIGQVSQEPEYIKAYKAGMDLHSLTASKVFKVPIEKYKKPMPDEQSKQRSIAKTVNFGIAYGMWTQGLIGNLQKAGIETSEEEAEEVINGFYKAYPQVSKYLREVSEKGLKDLSIRNKAGRLMKFEPPKEEKDKGSIRRESKNLPIQSLCADMIKEAMTEIYLRLEPKGVKFINTIHDELVFECPDDMAQEVAQVVKEEMEKAGSKYLTDMPCISEVSKGKGWKK